MTVNEKYTLFEDSKNPINSSNSEEEEGKIDNNYNLIYNNIDENNQKDPKKRSIIIIEDLIDEKNQIKKENKLKKNKTKNIIKQISIILNKPRNILFSIVLYILSIISILIAVGLYNIREINHNYILLCFEFKPIPQNYYTKEFFVFLTSVYATYYIFFIIISILLLICYCLIKNNNNFSAIYFEDTSIFFPIYLICFIIKSFIGIFFLMDLFQIYFHLILTIIGFICLIYIFIQGKKRRYDNIFNLICQNFYPSILLCFELYSLLFLICRILTIGQCESYNRKYKVKVELIGNLIYFLSGVSIMIFYKDILFPLTLVIIETGLLTKAGSSEFLLVILNIFFLSFMFYSSIFVIITNKSNIFKLELQKREEKVIYF